MADGLVRKVLLAFKPPNRYEKPKPIEVEPRISYADLREPTAGVNRTLGKQPYVTAAEQDQIWAELSESFPLTKRESSKQTFLDELTWAIRNRYRNFKRAFSYNHDHK